jgi:hypothetical protein
VDARARTCIFHVEYQLFLLDFDDKCIFSTDFLRKLKYQISSTPSTGSQVVPRGQTDRQDVAQSRFSHFRERD